MPQFQFAENFLPQFAWLALFFAVLYFGIVRLTLPKLGRVVAQREDKVTGDLAAAERAKAASDELSASYQSGVDAAHQRARATILEAQTRAQAEVERTLAAANADIGQRQAAADAALAASRSSALAEIELVAQDVAADIVERLTGKRPASGVLSRAMAQVQPNLQQGQVQHG